ncbi:amidinotransferase [Hyphomicrobium sp.]|uniref:amidinotransferase n=1 Tax=Hyphomicrobium sp. TaxID=82 RepID=UPI0025C57785|nr:amidinotransferase [Hyphomicrobium sp.]MCC7252177.1 amidinotransferase [Hyphomicrobium sp.]
MMQRRDQFFSTETLSRAETFTSKAAGVPKSRVWSCNEWDPLEEVIVGNVLNARYPTPDLSTQVAEFPDRPLSEIPRGPFPQRVIEETEEDLNGFAEILEKAGVTVKRPDTWPHDATFSTINWNSQGYYNYCPRDIMMVIGDQIIETPNVIRSRAQETFSYRSLLMEYMRSGARWYSAPKPMLLDSLFEGVDLDKPTPHNHEPAFDAANVLRFGRDLIYLVSATGNELGGHWLQACLGDTYRVHFLKDVYFGSHIDSTIVALRPGLVLCNPGRLNDETLPAILKQWEVIYSPPMENTDRHDAAYLSNSIGSDWIDMNAFSINPNLVVVDRNQPSLIKLLEKHGLDVIPLKLRHSKLLGGGPHCITLDVRRKGTLERYFD